MPPNQGCSEAAHASEAALAKQPVGLLR